MASIGMNTETNTRIYTGKGKEIGFFKIMQIADFCKAKWAGTVGFKSSNRTPSLEANISQRPQSSAICEQKSSNIYLTSIKFES